jgi:hypothetical protein
MTRPDSAIRAVVLAWIFIASVTPRDAADTNALDAALLKGAEIPKECKDIGGEYPADIQTSILYKRYDIYKGTLPPLTAKTAQSFECRGQKGTIFYFEFAGSGDRKQAEQFIRPLLWGEDHPTVEHPEGIEGGDNVLVVISFGRTPDALLKALRTKLSRIQASSQTQQP